MQCCLASKKKKKKIKNKKKAGGKRRKLRGKKPTKPTHQDITNYINALCSKA